MESNVPEEGGLAQRQMAKEIAYRVLESTKMGNPKALPTPEEARILAREFLKTVDGYSSKVDRPLSLKDWK